MPRLMSSRATTCSCSAEARAPKDRATPQDLEQQDWCLHETIVAQTMLQAIASVMISQSFLIGKLT